MPFRPAVGMPGEAARIVAVDRRRIRPGPPAEAGAPPPSLMQAIAQLGMEAGARMTENGGMSHTATLTIRKGQLLTDGPFAEAKEVVGGFAVYELPSEAEALAWTERFMDLHRQHWPAWDGEVVIRQLHHFVPSPCAVE